MTSEIDSTAVVTSPAVRLRPPSWLTESQWVAEDLLQRTRFSLPPIAVLLFVACMTPQDETVVALEIARRLQTSADAVRAMLEQMKSVQILLESGSTIAQRFQAIRSEWASFGWTAAADYHALTYDYEYLDYTRELAVDAETMHEYYAREPDIHRFKIYEGAERLALPELAADLIPVPFSAGWEGASPSQGITFATVSSLLSMVFGKSGELSRFVASAEPLIQRTSPSGGSRHPTEAYLISNDVPDLPQGWYHIRVDQPALERLPYPVDRDEMASIFAGPYRAPFDVRAIVALTSVFDRNMYRYREPRTFRTVYMDAGHLTTSVEVAGRALGIATFAHHGIDDQALEAKLGLHRLEEGAVLAIALG